jgi:hypothetical protein
MDDFRSIDGPLRVAEDVVETLAGHRERRLARLAGDPQMTAREQQPHLLGGRRDVEVADENVRQRCAAGDVAEVRDLGDAGSAEEAAPGGEMGDEERDRDAVQVDVRLEE